MSIDDVNNSVDESFEFDSEMIPTEELLKSQRKKSYEAAKAKRKSDKKSEKIQKRESRLKARQEKDEQLWAAMRSAKDLEE